MSISRCSQLSDSRKIVNCIFTLHLTCILVLISDITYPHYKNNANLLPLNIFKMEDI